MPMNIENIVDALKAERDRLDAAIAALTGTGTGNGRRGMHRKSINPINPGKPKRRLSAAGRKRISEAAKARWAKARKTAKVPSKASTR